MVEKNFPGSIGLLSYLRIRTRYHAARTITPNSSHEVLISQGIQLHSSSEQSFGSIDGRLTIWFHFLVPSVWRADHKSWTGSNQKQIWLEVHVCSTQANTWSKCIKNGMCEIWFVTRSCEIYRGFVLEDWNYANNSDLHNLNGRNRWNRLINPKDDKWEKVCHLKVKVSNFAKN